MIGNFVQNGTTKSLTVKYVALMDPITDITFLGTKASGMCNNIPTYWQVKDCNAGMGIGTICAITSIMFSGMHDSAEQCLQVCTTLAWIDSIVGRFGYVGNQIAIRSGSIPSLVDSYITVHQAEINA
jgi:BRICHOS domain